MDLRRFRCLLIIALLSSVTTMFAQKLDGHFVSRTEAEGTIYFLYPREIFRGESDGKMMTHDLTVRPACDSTVMNFTYRMATPTPIDSVVVTSSGGLKVGRKAKRLFLEPDGKEWVHRYSLEGHYGEFKRFYSVEHPVRVELYTKDGKSFRYVADQKAWKKYAPIGGAIFSVIELNVD